MFADICIPSGNENDFIEMALKLGTKELVFLYDKKENVKKPEVIKGVKIVHASILGKKPSFSGMVFASGEKQNIENSAIDFLYGFELLEDRDSFHYRRSGANQVIGKMLKDKEKVMVFDMEKIIVSKSQDVLIGRMMQNLVLAKKYKFDVVICSFASLPENMRAGKEYEALIRSLGFQEEARLAVNTLSERINSQNK
jgi:hypothetical protein